MEADTREAVLSWARTHMHQYLIESPSRTEALAYMADEITVDIDLSDYTRQQIKEVIKEIVYGQVRGDV